MISIRKESSLCLNFYSTRFITFKQNVFPSAIYINVSTTGVLLFFFFFMYILIQEDA